MRNLLGLSQEELAKAADVSQGAISRAEFGDGLATPLLTYTKVFIALATEIETLPPHSVAPEVLEFIESLRKLVPTMMSTKEVTTNPQLAHLLTLFGDMPVENQREFITIALPLAQFVKEKR